MSKRNKNLNKVETFSHEDWNSIAAIQRASKDSSCCDLNANTKESFCAMKARSTIENDNNNRRYYFTISERRGYQPVSRLFSGFFGYELCFLLSSQLVVLLQSAVYWDFVAFPNVELFVQVSPVKTTNFGLTSIFFTTVRVYLLRTTLVWFRTVQSFSGSTLIQK